MNLHTNYKTKCIWNYLFTHIPTGNYGNALDDKQHNIFFPDSTIHETTSLCGEIPKRLKIEARTSSNTDMVSKGEKLPLLWTKEEGGGGGGSGGGGSGGGGGGSGGSGGGDGGGGGGGSGGGDGGGTTTNDENQAVNETMNADNKSNNNINNDTTNNKNTNNDTTTTNNNNNINNNDTPSNNNNSNNISNKGPMRQASITEAMLPKESGNKLVRILNICSISTF